MTLVTLPFISTPNSSLNISSSTVVLSPSYTLENCSCDDPYQGLSCDSCARGYYRPSGSVADECLRCECNGKTADCDVTDGRCLNCGGNTTGNNCERCLDGFYGDPTSGVPCLPCDCPQVGRGFSPTCYLNATDGRSVCDNCSRGYAGRNCDQCMNGYYGNPLVSKNLKNFCWDLYMYTHTYMHTYTHTYIHTYIHIHIHTHIYTHSLKAVV